MAKISIVDLEVFYCVGVTEKERAKPQRLLLSVEMELDITSAARSDRIERTIDYQAVADDLLKYGEGRSWKLLEKLVANLADKILTNTSRKRWRWSARSSPFRRRAVFR